MPAHKQVQRFHDHQLLPDCGSSSGSCDVAISEDSSHGGLGSSVSALECAELHERYPLGTQVKKVRRDQVECPLELERCT